MAQPISSLQCANRVEIFRHLAVDDLAGVDMSILDSVACNNYDAFLEFCDKVYAEKDKIQDISCTLNGDSLEFNIEYQK